MKDYSDDDLKEVDSEDTGNKPKKKDKKNKLRVLIPILIVIILLLLLRSCNSSLINTPIENPKFDLSEDVNAQNGKVEGKSQEEIETELNQKVEDGMINISMNLNPIFEDGSSEGNLLIVNEEINNHPQVIEIYLKDSEDLVYKSGLIPVGSRIDSGELIVDLDKGEYPCTAYFNSVDGDTGDLLGKAGAEISLTVKN